MKCTLCGKDLPENEFYPSLLKKKQHHCKKCFYEHYQKKAIKKYEESLKKFPELDFNRYCGGYEIKILNYAKNGEYKYIIKSTVSEFLQTNDKEKFINKIKNILDNE